MSFQASVYATVRVLQSARSIVSFLDLNQTKDGASNTILIHTHV